MNYLYNGARLPVYVPRFLDPDSANVKNGYLDIATNWSTSIGSYADNPYLILEPEKVAYETAVKKIQQVNEGVCYFDSSSKFPRFKLAESKFKRCIKPEKATVGIIGDVNTNIISRGNVRMYTSTQRSYNTVSSIVVIFDDVVKKLTRTNNTSALALLASNEEAFLDKYYNQYASHKKIYEGPVWSITDKFRNMKDFILSPHFKVVMTDTMLDTSVNGTLPDIDVDTFNSISELLRSSDYTTVAVGMKMLSGYNVSKCSNAVKNLLMSTPKIWSTNESTSVGFKQLCAHVGLSRNANRQPANFGMFKKETITEDDKKLLKETIRAEIETYMRNTVQFIQNGLDCFDFKLDWKLEDK